MGVAALKSRETSMASLLGDLSNVSVAANIELLILEGLLQAHTPIIFDSHMQLRINEIRLNLDWLLAVHKNRLMF